MNSSPPRTILFVCTGNYYRSRFAEMYFNQLAFSRELSYRAVSRGLLLSPANIGPISPHALGRLRQLGVALNVDLRHPLVVNEEDLSDAEYIVALKESEHREPLQRRFPKYAERIEYWNIHDLDCAEPAVALPQLEADVAAIIQRLLRM